MKQTTIPAKIYQPAKTAMQSGKAKTNHWVLEFERPTTAAPDALMGWNTMPNTLAEIKLTFDSCEAAVAYATRKGITYTVRTPEQSVTKPKSYAENFSTSKRRAWDEAC